MRKILRLRFFNRSTVIIAKELLGKFLVRRFRGKTIFVMITEVEAYDGFFDKASHASRGRTARNAPMFGTAGRWYIYFTYGMHWMLNIVTRERDYPAAILIRGAMVVSRPRKASQRGKQARELTSLKISWISGPARLTKFLDINGRFNAFPATRRTGLWIEDWGARVALRQIKRMPRVGVDYAGSMWSKKHLRFILDL